MTAQTRFGVAALQSIPYNEEIDRWRSLEALGFDSICVSDHFVDYTRPGYDWFECWTLLAALATHTKRVRIGTSVTNFAWRNPAFLARQALTVDHVSNGRLELGLGAGARGTIDPSYGMTGIPDYPPGERVARFREYVEIVDQLLRNKVSSYRGKYYSLEEACMQPDPVQKPRPPITIGALGPNMLRVAAKYADTWNTFGGSDLSRDEFVATVSRQNSFLDRECRRIGRDPETLRRSLLVFTPFIRTMYSSVQAFEDIVKEFVKIGISEFIIFYPWSPSDLPMLHKIAEAIPRLRETAT